MGTMHGMLEALERLRGILLWDYTAAPAAIGIMYHHSQINIDIEMTMSRHTST